MERFKKTKMKIKTAKIEDSQAICSLLKETFQEINSKDYPPRHIAAWVKFDSPEKIKEKIENKDFRNFLALEKNEIVGFLSLSPKKALVNSLYVKCSKIGQGIGSELLEFGEAIIKSQNKTEIQVHASKTAANFYKKKGYEKIKDMNLLVEGVKIPVIEMVKRI